MAKLKEAEYLADTILHKLEQLLKERSFLRKEMVSKSDGSLEQDKAFIHGCRTAIMDNYGASAKAFKLERLLQVR